MRDNDRPVLLTVQELRKPIASARQELCDMRAANEVGLKHVLRHGLFVMGVSVFETMINDVMAIYYRRIPQRLPGSQFTFSRDEWLSDDPLGMQVDKALHGLSYSKTEDILRQFTEALCIEPVQQECADQLIEIKETRNLLLHNALQVNKQYLSKTRDIRRANRLGDKLKVDHAYADESLCFLDQFAEALDERIASEYVDYTKVAMLRRLWDYLFDSPLLQFDDYWETGQGSNRIYMKTTGCEDQLAHSERMFLGVWRTHFSGNSKHLTNFDMFSLDSTHHAKMLYFLSALEDIRLG